MAAIVITEDQIQDFQEAFFFIDKDSDGLISKEEFARLVQSLDGDSCSTGEDVEARISTVVDAGNDGMIDFMGFLTILLGKMEENGSDELKEAFKVFDRDQDGFISPSELRQVMMNLGERLTMEEAEQMIREADLDGDGRVSFEEFARMMVAFN